MPLIAPVWPLLGGATIVQSVSTSENASPATATSAPTTRTVGNLILAAELQQDFNIGGSSPNYASGGSSEDVPSITPTCWYGWRTATNNSSDDWTHTGGGGSLTITTRFLVATTIVSAGTTLTLGSGFVHNGTTACTTSVTAVVSPGSGYDYVFLIARTNSGGGTPTIDIPSGYAYQTGGAIGTRSAYLLARKAIGSGSTGSLSTSAAAPGATELLLGGFRIVVT